MYPATYYSLFPAFPRTATVFVAMSFDERFRFRWENVIRPAVEAVSAGGSSLLPVRVDARVVGDSILTEILQGIGTSQVVVADITAIGVLDGRPVRNGNVMYEVGLAHAVRLPEEVLLFRSDQDSLLFDTANTRVNFYRPDEHASEAKDQVAEAIRQALQEVDLKRHLAVRAAADSLDYPGFEVLNRCHGRDVPHPPRKTMGNALEAVSTEAALQRLLAAGLLRAKPHLPENEGLEEFKAGPGSGLFRYAMTPFGLAVMQEFLLRFDVRRLAEIVAPIPNSNGG